MEKEEETFVLTFAQQHFEVWLSQKSFEVFVQTLQKMSTISKPERLMQMKLGHRRNVNTTQLLS